MRVLVANIEEVFREAAARWTLVAYFVLSSLFILLFASAVNLDIVNGSLAGAELFGKPVEMRGETISIEKLVLGFESVFSGVLYVIGIFLAVFATAHLVPRLQEKGTIDLYLSRPVARTKLLLSRYVAGLLLALVNIVYLIGSMWAIVIWKTQVFHPRFMLGGAIIFFAVAVLLAWAFLIGTVTSSTAVSIMTTYFLFLFSTILSMHDRIEAAVSAEWKAKLIHSLYWILPKTQELGGAVVAFVSGGEAPEKIRETLSFWPFASTALFGVGCLILASWVFQRKEF
ncbi:MAG TPA: ABC transporter permease subunit [Thermoanaerobaculia bacterium]